MNIKEAIKIIQDEKLQDIYLDEQEALDDFIDRLRTLNRLRRL